MDKNITLLYIQFNLFKLNGKLANVQYVDGFPILLPNNEKDPINITFFI